MDDESDELDENTNSDTYWADYAVDRALGILIDLESYHRERNSNFSATCLWSAIVMGTGVWQLGGARDLWPVVTAIAGLIGLVVGLGLRINGAFELKHVRTLEGQIEAERGS